MRTLRSPGRAIAVLDSYIANRRSRGQLFYRDLRYVHGRTEVLPDPTDAGNSFAAYFICRPVRFRTPIERIGRRIDPATVNGEGRGDYILEAHVGYS